jgi:hypothetical protein
MKKTLDRALSLFNWRANPGNVFYVAIPLAALAFSLHGLAAFLKWRQDGDVWYAVMLLVAVVVLCIALIPAWRMHQTSQRLARLTESYRSNAP